MSDSLEERLKSHAKAFDGLLSLIPAKYYYGDDNSDQWRKKKQTKDEAQKAKRAKLDPDSAKSAKDIMDENARKRKREEEGGDVLDGFDDVEGIEREQPKEGLKKGNKGAKKQKKDANSESHEDATQTEEQQTSDPTEEKTNKALKRKEKKERKKSRAQAQTEKQEAKKARKEEEKSVPENGDDKDEVVNHEDAEEPHDDDSVADMERIDIDGLAGEGQTQSTASSSPAPGSHEFDQSVPGSTASSTSSVVPSTDKDEQSKSAAGEKQAKPKVAPEELKSRLQARIDALRAARKADGINGAPAKNRQELMEARRRKEEQRRTHKKELRQKAKEAEQLAREETLSRLNSPTTASNAGSFGAADDSQDQNFSFGRIAFGEGQQLDPSGSGIVDIRKRRGPQDPYTALKAAQSKQARVNGYDEDKRADIEEKDLWLNAKKRAHGEKIRDDTALLKKTLKRKEQAKKKSEKAWNERLEGVEKGKEMRQRKREENLRKRKEEKGSKGKGKKAGKPGKKVKRPGFEGSFKAKSRA
ncbi:SURF6-domain-containing protein [Xylona heveae TC161]|uniref:SURF6-domain-containing protein n=1 Tax=Xylona heveae (strain CBS 132557 / TC161) TaxID=1328760 RepID=A0A165J8F4_XYLHT|nr:SURF6-domain-containing protein [Xylona heveae TC161]KZF25889.1 SURF6-domain-containing protein [Xylona heveae TC161]